MDVNGEDAKGFSTVQGPIHPDYGQRGAFPGLETGDSDELFYGPASDGMAYLRMVRNEAQTVPKLLRVADTSISALDRPAGSSSTHVRYEDGAIIGGPRATESSIDNGSNVDHGIQQTYYRNLIARFLRLRKHLADVPASMRDQSSGGAPRPLQIQARKPQWNYDLKHTAPTPAALAKASQADVIRGLGRLEALLSRGCLLIEEERSNLACWSWALLGKCRELGLLDSEAVSTLRDLAKKALLLGSTLRKLQSAGQVGKNGESMESKGAEEASTEVPEMEEGEVDDVTGEHEEEEESERAGNHDGSTQGRRIELEVARRAILERLNSTGIDGEADMGSARREIDETVANALIALDIIVTIVGTVFGQRDLLELRRAWP